MNRTRLGGVSAVALAALVLFGCGSATRPASSITTTTVSPAARLDLASGGRASSPLAKSEGSAIFPERPSKYVLDARLSDLGGSAVVWRMKAHSLHATEVQRFATVLDVAGSPTRTSGGWEVRSATAIVSFVVSTATVEVSYASGVPGAVGGSGGAAGTATPPGAVVNGGLKVAPAPAPSPVPAPLPRPAIVPEPAAPVDVPSATDATTIARRLLDRLGVLDGQDWSSAVNESGGIAVSCAVGAPCPTGPPVVSARTVTFALVRDGTRVDGADWSVTIGEHQRIASLDGEWASPTAIGSYPLRSSRAVFADLQHGRATYAGPQPMAAATGALVAGAPTIAMMPLVTVRVTGVALGIARWDAYDDGHAAVDLVPTYRFHTRNGANSSYDIEVLALDPGVITFTGPSPGPGPLPSQPNPGAGKPPNVTP